MSGGWAFTPEWSNNQSAGASTTISAGTGLTISTSSVNVKNTYTQLVASTTGDINMLEVYQSVNPLPTNSTVYTDIAVGAGGSEVIVANNLILGAPISTTLAGNRFCLPVNIPSGSRIAARHALSSSTTTTTTVGPFVAIAGFENGMVGAAPFAGVDSVGQNNGVGTVIGTTTTANTKSAYYQLTAASTQDYAGFIIGFNTGTANSNILVDVAVGAGGSETNIVSNYWISCGNAQFSSNSMPIMIPIPSGTRLSARAQSGTVSGLVGLSLYGIYE